MSRLHDAEHGDLMTFANMEYLIARHLDERAVVIDPPTRRLLAQLRDLAADQADRVRSRLVSGPGG
jgi:hypothetical protein